MSTKREYLLQDLLKTRELFFKYFKRGWKPGKNASSLSLSSPIEEEPTYNAFHAENGRNVYSSNEDFVGDSILQNPSLFDKLADIRANACYREALFESENSFFKNDAPYLKYQSSADDSDSEDFTNNMRNEDYSLIACGCSPQTPVQIIPAVSAGSTCCSLV